MKSIFTLLVLCMLSFAVQAHADEDLGAQVEKIFTTHCYRCHGQNGTSQGGFGNVLKLHELAGSKKIVPKDPHKSQIFKRMSPDLIGDMPEDGETTPTADELATVKRWIEAGAPLPLNKVLEPNRPFYSLGDEVKAIDEFLTNKIDRRQWNQYRFFSLRSLHNAPRDKVRDEDLVLYQAALAKLLNSLSWNKDIIEPQKVDAAGIILAVNIRELDWQRQSNNLWEEILRKYPYGLSHARYPEDPAINNHWISITEKTGSEIPILRTDWFIAVAARPPLYHTLAQIPEHLDELLKKIPTSTGSLNLNQNIIDGKVARSGFNGSGVSERNNRLIERHDTNYGAFWISYDFKVSAGKGNLFVSPLGPKFEGNPHNQHAFEHDGGEIIFNLPNGMQAYMLVDQKGNRIDEGPIAIVSDGNEKRSGTPAIVNGISCIACHRDGMIRKSDQILTGHHLGGTARDRIKEIYPTAAIMDKLFDKDAERFQDAATKSIKPFLLTGDNARKTIKDFAEPVSPIAKWYIVPELTLNDVARELGIEDTAKLKGIILGNEELQRHGLYPLTQGNTIKREVWESQDFIRSAFQRCAQKLGLGEPKASF